MANEIILNENRAYSAGALLDKYDERDFLFKELIGRSAASAMPNWNLGYSNPFYKSIPVKDQGSSSACGGEHGAYQAGLHEAMLNGVYIEKSARFIYAQNYEKGGGMYGRKIDDQLIKFGVCNEHLLKSGQTEKSMTKSSDITDSIRAQAKFAKAAAYGIVDLTMNSLAQALDNGGVVRILIAGKNNGTWHSKYPIAVPYAQTTWNHFLTLVKYGRESGGTNYLEAVNSWGDDIGDGGYQRLTQDFIDKKCILQARTIVEIADKVGYCAADYIGKDKRTTSNLKLRRYAGITEEKITVIPKGTLVDTLEYGSELVDGYKWVKTQVLSN